jgi:hypothetical protein
MQISGEEHSTELFKIFSQEVEQEMIVAVELAAEEEADSINFVELHKELEILEKNRHIQQAKLETDGGAYQPKEFGDIPIGELAEEKMSERGAKQQLNHGTVELDSPAEWITSATRGSKDRMGDQDYLPTDKVELQPRRLHKKSHLLEQMDKVIEEIRKLVLIS